MCVLYKEKSGQIFKNSLYRSNVDCVLLDLPFILTFLNFCICSLISGSIKMISLFKYKQVLSITEIIYLQKMLCSLENHTHSLAFPFLLFFFSVFINCFFSSLLIVF